MAVELNNSDYEAIVKEAVAAVASVKDPELRRVAFEKILQTLLDGVPAGSGKADAKSKAKKQPKRKATRKGARPARKSQGGPKAYIETLIKDAFFKKQRTIAEVKAELANRGHHVALTSLSGPLQKLTQQRRLRRQKAAVNGKGTKITYAYSNW